MVYRRKRTAKRSSRRVKRKMMRTVPRSLTNVNRGVYFKRTFWGGTWDWNNVTTSGFFRRIYASLSLLPNYSEYAALFDEFKMHGVKVTFHPRYGIPVQQQQINSTAYTNQVYITYAPDTHGDPSNVASGLYNSSTYNSFLEMVGSRAKTKPIRGPISVYFKPTFAMTDNNQTVMKNPGWLNFNSNGSETMYSAWAFIHDYNFANADAAATSFDIQYTYYFSARGQA